MPTKTQKRHAQKYKEQKERLIEELNNLDENQIASAENYAVFQILYINDVAYNCCKALGEEIKTIPYKSKTIHKVYGALMKRWNTYRDIVEHTGIDQYTIANLFCEMDEYMDDKVKKLLDSIQNILIRENVIHSHWIASCVTAQTVCQYAECITEEIIQKTSKISKNIWILRHLKIQEPLEVMSSMLDKVNQINVKTEIDLNKEETIQIALRQLNKAFCNPYNFKEAQQIADAENISEGRDTVM